MATETTERRWRGPSAEMIRITNENRLDTVIATDEEILEIIKQQFNLHNNLYADFRLYEIRYTCFTMYTINIDGNPHRQVSAELSRIEEMIPYVVESEFGCPYQVFLSTKGGNPYLTITLIKNMECNHIFK